ncbi:hypothetical protein C5L14_23230 [Labrys okinawensis]|uniref:Uncharacterized protein n=1 Tax=Labrys okinawensis TaxID=346911 RepID=A0A2S9Q7N0_9HYPH|nr:hypothetical protein [Labrys okinawensis]PRH85356.1 hypothetical protein C5L14_23230 [Labrys okinawensis]
MADEFLKFDFSAFQKMAAKLKVAEQQLPFALSRALNESAFVARSTMVDDWPGRVQSKNSRFLGWALGVKKATKNDLTVTISDERAGGRTLLKQLADGGTHTGQGRLAVPVAGQRRGARGIVPSQRPRNLKQAFRKGDVIYEVVGKGKRKRLRLAYVLKSSVTVPKRVPFRETFNEVMKREMAVRAPRLMLEAMKTAIRR